MNSIETKYFNLNKFLLVIVGLWPFKQSKLIRLQFILFLTILTSAIFFQFSSFLTVKYTSKFALKSFPTTLCFIFCLIKYIAFAVNIENMKYLLAQLQYVYNNLENEYENLIVEKYNHIAKWYTVILTALAVFAVIIMFLVQFWSIVYDVVLSENASRSYYLPIITEYFIDQQKYFYLITLHTHAATCVGFIAMVAIGTILVAYLEHTCGMFTISSYRIECVMKFDMLQNVNLENENIIIKRIICAIDIHRQAMKLSKLMTSKFEIMLFCLIGVGVVSLSLSLLRVHESGDNFKEYLFPFIIVISIITYMYVANNVGQDVTDHYKQMFVAVYSMQWYLSPLHIQKIILFLLQRSAKDFTMGVGGLFIGSLECFATLVKASVSYFTVMHSIQ